MSAVSVDTGVTPAALLVPDMEPGSAAWLACMTASKVPAVLGLSPWDSPFSLWHRMAGLIEATPATALTDRGHYLEPAVAAWWGDQHPEYVLMPGATYRHAQRPWQVATPDRFLCPVTDAPPAVLEVKTAARDEDWGEPGTDDIPVYYRAQVMWQMDTLGVLVAHVAVLTSYLELREYVVAYDPGEAELIRGMARAFLDSLPGGRAQRRPDLDDHAQTYLALRQLHPDIEPRDVAVDPTLAQRYLSAVAAARAADSEKQAATTALADAIGPARRGTCRGLTLATRQAKKTGIPYLVTGRHLPTVLPEEA